MGDAVVSSAEPEAPAQSFPERLMGVFISPGETFEDVARKPGFWAPLIVLVLGSVAVVETMLWKIGAERLTRMGIEQSSRASSMPPEQINQAVSQGAYNYLLSGLPFGTFLLGATYNNSSQNQHYTSAGSGISVVVKVTWNGEFVNDSINGSVNWVQVPYGSPIAVPVR